MIIPYALQQFLFCGSEVYDRDRGAVCPGDRNRSRHVVCHGADGGCTKGPARGYGGVSRIWDLMRGRYEGIRSSALWVLSIAVSEVTARYGAVLTGPRGVMCGLSAALVVPHGCMGIRRSGGARWMLCWLAAGSGHGC